MKEGNLSGACQTVGGVKGGGKEAKSDGVGVGIHENGGI